MNTSIVMVEKQKATIHYINSDTVHTDIMEFLGEYDSSPNTKSAYERDIRNYFMHLCGKDISLVTKVDVEQGRYNEPLLNKHANRYKKYLIEQHPDSMTSVIRKISTVRALYRYLQINGYNVNYMIFNTKGLKADTESYDNIPSHLIFPMSELAKENQYFGLQLSNFILVAAQTSIRVNALLALTKKNIKYNDISGYHTVTVTDKGNNKRTCPIDDMVYGRLMELIESGDKDNELVFQNIQSDWIRKAIKKMAESFPELKGKYITTHSLRHTAATFEMDASGDIRSVMEQTGHRSVETAIGIYSKKDVDYGKRAGIRMMKEVNESALDNLSKDEVLEMLKRINKGAYHQLLLEVNKGVEL